MTSRFFVPELRAKVEFSRALKAAVTYFAGVFLAAFLIGPARMFGFEPLLGLPSAILLEAIVLMVATAIVARIVTDRMGLVGHHGTLFVMGCVALVLAFASEFVFGLLVEQLGLGEQALYLLSSAGRVYVLLLVVFAFLPLMVDLVRGMLR